MVQDCCLKSDRANNCSSMKSLYVIYIGGYVLLLLCICVCTCFNRMAGDFPPCPISSYFANLANSTLRSKTVSSS